MEETKVMVSKVIPVMSKITKHKLNGTNYLDWSKMVQIYLRIIDKDDHLIDDPPTDEKQTWLRDDSKLFLQIRNSIDSEVISLINHSEFIKELMKYLDLLYSRKEKISRMNEVRQVFYCLEKQDKSLTTYFMHFKRVNE